MQQSHTEAQFKEARRTITDLYYSWETNNLPQYMACWDPSAVQLSDNYTRNYNQIAEKRAGDFQRFKRVVVKSLKFESQEIVEDHLIQMYCLYSMHFETKDGKSFNETDIRDRFFLVYTKDKKAKIVRNDTYVNAPAGSMIMLDRDYRPPAPAPSVEGPPTEEQQREAKESKPLINKWLDLPSPKRY